jgi:hypothetical protein
MNTALHHNEIAEIDASRIDVSQISPSQEDDRNSMDADFTFDVCCGEEMRSFPLEDGRFVKMCDTCGQKQTDNSRVRYGGSPWIGVDFDGTLARDLGSRYGDEIGGPIEPMLLRVKQWIANGHTVKIFTARASSPRQVAAIKKWLAKYGLPDLEVTNVKDLRMVELWDDRCVQVTTNLGEPIAQQTKFKGTNRLAESSSLPGITFRFFNRLKVSLFM